MIEKLKTIILSNATNIIGWKTKRKIVVFESDDWGTIRMPSKEVYNLLTGKGLHLNDNYNSYDSLESEEDLIKLFEVLNSVKDRNGDPAVFTANFVMTNPDFNLIKENQFENYKFELFTNSYKRYGYDNAFSLVLEGNSYKVFHPQLHGRDHINFDLWMKSLQVRDPDVLLGFQSGFFGLQNNSLNPGMRHYMAALDYHSKDEVQNIKNAIVEGTLLFEKAFKYKSKSFIAACYTWDKEVEKTLAENQVKYLQGNFLQLLPINGGKRRGKRVHYLGQKNRFNQTYLIRNVLFEPSERDGFDWVNFALKNIEMAFKFKKPAIISSHRVNYIGSINIKNRDNNLILLGSLIMNITKRWPDVEFMTSDALGDIINADKW